MSAAEDVFSYSHLNMADKTSPAEPRHGGERRGARPSPSAAVGAVVGPAMETPIEEELRKTRPAQEN